MKQLLNKKYFIKYTKLNSKGFAVTGTLYGLLILFLLVITSLLVILRSKFKDYQVTEEIINNHITMNNTYNINKQLDSSYVTEYRGKYTFTINNDKTCSSYLPSNITLELINGILIQNQDTEVTLIGNDCNNTSITNVSIVSVVTNVQNKNINN